MSAAFDQEKYFSTTAAIVVFAWGVWGVLGIIDGLLPTFDTNPSIVQAPVSEVVLGILWLVGSVLALMSRLKWRREDVTWGLELWAWPILAAAWVMYSAFVTVGTPPAWSPMVMGIAFFVACVHRFRLTIRVAYRTRQEIRKMDNDAMDRES